MLRIVKEASPRTWIVFGALTVALVLAAGSGLRAQQDELKLGSYDPYGTFADVQKLSIEHVYLPWDDIDLDTLDAADNYAVDKDRSLLVTVEPWSWVPRNQVSAKQLYVNMKVGKYDQLIANVCSKLDNLTADVTVRFGHEMDLGNGRYPWSQLTPAQYIEVYQYFTQLCRQNALSLKYMWSPRGEVTLADYYPGSDYVDMVGVSVFSHQEQDQKEFGRDRSVKEVLEPVYQRVAELEKPVVVPEFGCFGDKDFQKRCYRDITKLKTYFPQITAVVYFNEKETFAWPEPYGKPDWRVPADFFSDDIVAAVDIQP